MTSINTAIGIDFGSSRFVIGVAKKGGVEIIVNEASYRQTPCLVSFGSERRVGDRALAHVKKELKNAILYPSRLLADVNSNVLLNEELFNYSRIKLKEDGRAEYHVNYEGSQIAIAPEQAVAALFTEVLDILALNGIDNKEAVVSVPAYFNQIQRQAMIDAAKIAGVEVVKLYNESSATVMNYGIFRRPDLSADKPRTVGFVDFGHSKSSVYVANIWNDRAEILIEETDPNLGVRNMDFALLRFYLQMFEKKYKVDLMESPKALYRLMEAIEKQRKILTANIEAAISVECIFEDIDFFYMMKREEFEQLTSATLSGLQTLVMKCASWVQNVAKLSLHSVERVGGGTRIPTVETLIQKSFNVPNVSKTLDANESVARGCAIQAAILSPLFKVASFKVTDKILYPVSISLQYEGEEVKSKTLFDKGAEFNKVLSLNINKPARLLINLFNPSMVSGETSRRFLEAAVQQINPKESKSEAKVWFLLNKNGMAMLDKAELRETYIAEEKIPMKKPPQDKPDANPNEKQETIKEEDEFTIEKKERVRVTNINVDANLLYGLQQEQLQSMAHFENLVIQKEKAIKETQRAKYFLESFIYNTRAKVNEQSNARYTTPAEKQSILQSLQSAESWLYEEGQNVDKDTYTKQLTKLQEVSKAFYARLKTMEECGLYYSEAMPAFNEFESKNAELLAHGSPVQLNELSQKKSESMALLKDFEHLLNNYSLQLVDQFDYESKRSVINKSYESMLNVLTVIKNEKEKKEREEKKRQEEMKKLEEEKSKSAEAQKQQEQQEPQANNNSNQGAEGKMEIED